MKQTWKRVGLGGIPGSGPRGEYRVYAPKRSYRVWLRPSRIHRTGCFAGEALGKGCLIGIYAGQATFDTHHPKTMVETALDGTEYGIQGEGPLSYMNHAKKPSCEMDGLLVYALRDLEENDELTIDYTS